MINNQGIKEQNKTKCGVIYWKTKI